MSHGLIRNQHALLRAEAQTHYLPRVQHVRRTLDVSF